jgi:hypothetical protein
MREGLCDEDGRDKMCEGVGGLGGGDIDDADADAVNDVVVDDGDIADVVTVVVVSQTADDLVWNEHVEKPEDDWVGMKMAKDTVLS